MIVLALYTLIFFHPGRLLNVDDAHADLKPTYSNSETLYMTPV